MLSPHTQQQHLHRQRSDITQPDEIEQEPAAADVAASDADAGVADTTASSGGAASSRISVFLRVRPVARPSPRVALEAADAAVEFTVPRDAGAGPVNNSRERYRFAFDGVLSPDALQDEVFERAARPLVEAALDGCARRGQWGCGHDRWRHVALSFLPATSSLSRNAPPLLMTIGKTKQNKTK